MTWHVQKGDDGLTHRVRRGNKRTSGPAGRRIGVAWCQYKAPYFVGVQPKLIVLTGVDRMWAFPNCIACLATSLGETR